MRVISISSVTARRLLSSLHLVRLRLQTTTCGLLASPIGNVAILVKGSVQLSGSRVNRLNLSE